MKYPKGVIATTSQGKKEARILTEKGSYVRYTYHDPETDKIVRQGKESIFLKNDKGKYEQLFIIPIKDKALLIKTKETEQEVKTRKVWDEKKKKAVELF